MAGPWPSARSRPRPRAVSRSRPRPGAVSRSRARRAAGSRAGRGRAEAAGSASAVEVPRAASAAGRRQPALWCPDARHGGGRQAVLWHHGLRRRVGGGWNPVARRAAKARHGVAQPAGSLEVEEGQVHLLLPAADPHGAADLIHTVANTEPRGQVAEDSVRLCHVVLLEAEPERRDVRRPRLLRGRDEDLDAHSREVVVRQVHLLDGRALLAELRQALRAAVVDLVLVELQDPELWAATADIEDHVEAARGELVLGEVDLLVRVAVLAKRQLAPQVVQAVVCDPPARVVQLVHRARGAGHGGHRIALLSASSA